MLERKNPRGNLGAPHNQTGRKNTYWGCMLEGGEKREEREKRSRLKGWKTMKTVRVGIGSWKNKEIGELATWKGLPNEQG